MKETLRKRIENFHQGRILVVGDLVIDEMMYGVTSRLSREAPVMILRHQRTDIILGAAGNAAHNVARLSAGRTAVVGVCGKDYHCALLLDALERDGIDASGVIQDESRPTSTKTRLSGIANHSVTQQIVRMDRESNAPLSPEVEGRLIETLIRMAPDFNAMILSDYGLGVLTPAVIECCATLSRRHGLILAVDSQRSLADFQGADILTPNQPEAEKNVGYNLDSPEAVLSAGRDLLAAANARNVLITRGESGMSLFERQSEPLQPCATDIPAFNRSEVFDVTGAGDTVIGALTLALTTGASMREAALLGNLAASIVVRRFGAATTTRGELTEALERLDATLLEALDSRPLQV